MTLHLTLAPWFCHHVGASFDKQCRLAEVVRDCDWSFDLASGLLSFGGHLAWQADILGTESESSGTWLWAWANQASGIPAPLLRASLVMKDFGDRHRIPELTEPQFPLGDVDGHFLALIASGVCRADAYYRAPYDGGAALLLIKDGNFPRPPELPLVRIASIFPRAIAAVKILNHRLALASYLAYYGLLGHSDGNRLLVTEDDEPLLIATFDEHDRLTQLDVTVPRAAP